MFAYCAKLAAYISNNSPAWEGSLTKADVRNYYTRLLMECDSEAEAYEVALAIVAPAPSPAKKAAVKKELKPEYGYMDKYIKAGYSFQQAQIKAYEDKKRRISFGRRAATATPQNFSYRIN